MKATLRTQHPQPSDHPTKEPIRTEDRIRQRAYDLYEQRGRVDGHAFDDWFQAELELTTKMNLPRAG